MSAPIRLFHFRSKSGVPNFGDELSPQVVAFVTGRTVEHAGRWTCDLTGIGSILDRYLDPKGRLIAGVRAALGRPIRVWGSGLIIDHPGARHSLVPLALRGQLTRDALGADKATPLGDPGLLSARMIARAVSRQEIGIVPHYSDKTHPMVAALARLPGVRIIDVERDGPSVCTDIASCAAVLSSSLHGLIVADAFGIPNHRLRFGGKIKGGDFKFLDYASALGRADIAAHSLATPEDALTLAKAEADFTYQAGVDALCMGLEQALKRAF